MMDSCLIPDGHFLLKGTLDAPGTAYITLRTPGAPADRKKQEANSTMLFLSPASMDLILAEDDFAHARLTGSPSQDEYVTVQEAKQRVEERYKVQLDSMMNEKDHEKAAAIRERLAPYFAEMAQKDYDFFSGHPQSYVTASLLIYHTADLPLDSLQLFYDRMGEKVQQSPAAKEIAAEIVKMRAGSPGAPAKDFTTKDIDDQPLTLSSFQGKAYVLIDFWASWCVPCRHSNPHLIELFHQYHAKGLEVIGVSDDDGKGDAWRKAVAKDGVGIWHNVLRGFDYDKLRNGIPNEKDISEKFGIHSLPTKILIDKNGIIIGRYGEGREDEASLDKKLQEIFL
jgi:thiol-disulfide isomerase/thioredoxin